MATKLPVDDAFDQTWQDEQDAFMFSEPHWRWLLKCRSQRAAKVLRALIDRRGNQLVEFCLDGMQIDKLFNEIDHKFAERR